MVKNSVTLDSLKKILYSDYKEIKSISEFFEKCYGSQQSIAKENFCNSLAAYSLVTYFLQIKDRHNGNILLHKDGYLVHIDFGFLLSNAPGKGIELEKKIPFKLLSDYIEILGGIESELFAAFRRRFYK